MSKIRVAILGASGVGKFHAREFKRAGADVVAILGSSKETAEKTAGALRSEYGIMAEPYHELERLLGERVVDTASVCTPDTLHYIQTKSCLMSRLNVMCEKPFVRNSLYQNSRLALELVGLAGEKKTVLTVNTQWPSVLKYIAQRVNLSSLRRFSMYSEPPGDSALEMLIDHLPHEISILVRLIPGGRAEQIIFQKKSEQDIEVHFAYSNADQKLDACYRFTQEKSRPRKIAFTFDGLEFRREIQESYKQKLVVGSEEFAIEDPFAVSIGKFVGAITGNGAPLISTSEIIENVALQDAIIKKYVEIYGTE